MYTIAGNILLFGVGIWYLCDYTDKYTKNKMNINITIVRLEGLRRGVINNTTAFHQLCLKSSVYGHQPGIYPESGLLPRNS